MDDLIEITIEIIRSKLISSFLIVMIVLAVLEYLSIKTNFKDYKPVIISIGILGTFIGIFYGLWDFNTEDITDSISALLEGLKLAFITSIAGMLISIVLSIIENGTPQVSNNDSEIILKDILNEQKEANKKTSLIHDSIERSEKNINRQFSMANESLKNALDALSKGATEEIITALEKVISDFNKNLTEQFGDNFKQLNESVKQMIIWQENYKAAIEQIEKSLQTAVTNIETISDHTQKFANSYEKISDHTQKFANSYEKISLVSKDLHEVIEANQNQIKNIEAHMNNLKKIGDEANLITASINDFSKSIKGSLSNQSEGFKKLSDNFGKQLESSLGSLNKALTSLTNKFKTDYEDFLKLFNQLLPKQ